MYPYRRPRSLGAPIVLIIIGAVFLLRNFGYINSATMYHWFARYWPVLIIIWGVVKLLEYAQARQQGHPVRSGIGGGGVVLLVFLIIFGLAASESERVNWHELGSQMEIDDDSFNFFGTTFNYTADVDQAIPSGATTLRVVSDRGDVTIIPWEQTNMKITVRKSVGAANESSAKQYDEQTKPQISTTGDTITVNANTGGAGDHPVRSNLEIFVPRKLAVDVTTKRGDLTVRDRQGDVKLNTMRGNASVDNVLGNVSLSVRRGDIAVNKISGDLNVDGRVNDSAISDVSGAVRLNGDFFGNLTLSKIGKGVSFKSSRTDLEVAKLDGDMTMQSGDLRADGLVGPIHVVTRAKDIHLDNVSGDVRIEDSSAEVEIRASKTPLGNIQVDNRHGRVALTVPARAGFQLDARTTRGDVETDFDSIKVESDHNTAHGSGTVGNGGPSVRLNTDNADIEVRKAG